MHVEEFETLVDRFGDDLSAWPVDARQQAEILLAESDAARETLERAKWLRRLATEPARVQAPAGLADRIVVGAMKARAPTPPAPRGLVGRSSAWLQSAAPRLRPAIILPLCFLVGLTAGWLPSLLDIDGISVDVPVLLTGMIE